MPVWETTATTVYYNRDLNDTVPHLQHLYTRSHLLFRYATSYTEYT